MLTLSPSLSRKKRAATPDDSDTLEGILVSDYYVGSPTLTQNVKWRRYKDMSILVRKDSDELAAELEWVGEIDASPATFYLYVCGKWRSGFFLHPSGKPQPFTNAKARGRIIAPTTSRWKKIISDYVWDSILEGFQRIQTSRSTEGAACRHTIVDTDGVKVRHSIFQPLDEEGREYPSNLEASMERWICQDAATQEELQDIIAEGKYEGQPLTVIGVDGRPILPKDYKSHLSGAIVHIKAGIVDQYFDSQNFDNYFADISEIRVLAPPAPPPQSPSKRRYQELLRQDAIACKRHRANV
ncbi:hypothetical protein BKA93DRAFT_822955 [Sparassis latifolia]|uniref:Uncharacterized protein n=1 Tax=Sparassis crispa TaxID=139825 RepID=A0A401GKI1_9APHY|nr:hypothetical protein SCP_0410680 [Sparassis crispa]GBE82683.1 hypothetical protein SCP_0410680 [Sparassis crispa]